MPAVFLQFVRHCALILAVAVVACMGGAAVANAQATRTWVSGVGDDANPCSRTAPCKTFAGAISKTAAGGQITVLDRGGYGAVTITKSISIVSEVEDGGIINSLVSGVIINAGVNDVVALHGLFIDGGGSGGLNGIRFLAGKSLHVSNCVIRNQTGATSAGINVEFAAGTGKLFVTNCDISRGSIGVRVRTTGTAAVQAQLDDVKIEGLSGAGIVADGTNSVIRVSDSTIMFNAPGLSVLNSGKITTFGNNILFGNTPDGAFTGAAALQ